MFKRLFFGTLLGGGTLLAAAAGFFHVGVSEASAQGVSLRQESPQGAGFFHAYRSHRGGGLRSGK